MWRPNKPTLVMKWLPPSLVALSFLACAGMAFGQSAGWFHFDGNAMNYGSGRAEWKLANTPFVANTLYLNGNYTGEPSKHPEGFLAYCSVGEISKDRHAVAIRFMRDAGTVKNRHIIGGGLIKNWFGIQVGRTGELELAFNAYRDVFPVARLVPRTGQWNWLVCSVDVPQHRCTVALNGQRATVELPKDFKLDEEQIKPGTGNSWTFCNGTNGGAFFGWVDELMIYTRPLESAEFTTLAQRPDLNDPVQPVIPKELTVRGKLDPKELAERPGKMSISSVGTSYSIAGKFEGDFQWNALGVKVRIKRGEIVRQKNGAYAQRHINGFHLFLGQTNPDGGVRKIIARSETIPVDTSITHGQSALLENETVTIPLKGVPTAELADTWLGVWITDSPDEPAHYKEGICLLESTSTLAGHPVTLRR